MRSPGESLQRWRSQGTTWSMVLRIPRCSHRARSSGPAPTVRGVSMSAASPSRPETPLRPLPTNYLLVRWGRAEGVNWREAGSVGCFVRGCFPKRARIMWGMCGVTGPPSFTKFGRWGPHYLR